MESSMFLAPDVSASTVPPAVAETRIELTLNQLLDPASRKPAECRSKTVVTAAVVAVSGPATEAEEPRLRACLRAGMEEGAVELLPVLVSFLGSPPESSRTLEALEQLCRRLVTSVPAAVERRYTTLGEVPAVTRVFVYLPLAGKRQKTVEHLTACSVGITGDGEIELCPADARSPAAYSQRLQTVLAVAANTAAPPTGGGWRLRFSDHRVMEGRMAGLFLPELLRFYGFPAAAVARCARLAGQWRKVSVEFDLSLPAATAGCWAELPEERTLRHYAALAAVSLRLQRSLRLWLPYIRFSDTAAFANRDAACAALLYHASRPFHLRQRPEFTYDPMTPHCIDRACRSARPRLEQSLARVEKMLESGDDSVLRELFSKRRSGEIIRIARRGNRHFLNVLEADKQAVGRALKLGLCCRDLRAQGSKARLRVRKLERLAEQIDRSFRAWYRRLLAGRDIAHLASLTLIEGTAALTAFQGKTAPLDVTLRLRRPDSHAADGFVFRAITRVADAEQL